MEKLNQRSIELPEQLTKRVSILVEYPETRFEAVIVQWSHFRPTVLIQLKYDPMEPLQFPGLRPMVPGNSDLPKDRPSELDTQLRNFVDPTTAKLFENEAFHADLVFSTRAFSILQPEPDMVLPDDPMWECRREALSAVGVADEPGIARAAQT